jgi:hypothetical protein
MAEKTYLHDANVNSIEILVEARIVRLHVTRYVSAASRERVDSVIEFPSVRSFSAVVDFVLMSSNAWAGNIEDWEPSLGLGVSHVYLVKGTLSNYYEQPIVSLSAPA